MYFLKKYPNIIHKIKINVIIVFLLQSIMLFLQIILHMVKKVFVYLILIFPLIAVSCGKYEKLLKSSDYNLKYEKAFEYYENGEYVRAATLFEQIANIYRGTVKADTVWYYRANSYLFQKDYIMAGHYFQELASTFPNSPYAEESAFMEGFCEYKQSPRPSLDQSNTYNTIAILSLFLIKYPNSSKKGEAQEIIKEMEEKLVGKSFLSAKTYYDLGAYLSAVIALRNSLNQFPETKYREEILFLILKSNYLIAQNSVQEKMMDRYQATVDEYYSFIGEFPNGKNAAEAKKIYEASMKVLGDDYNFEN